MPKKCFQTIEFGRCLPFYVCEVSLQLKII